MLHMKLSKSTPNLIYIQETPPSPPGEKGGRGRNRRRRKPAPPATQTASLNEPLPASQPVYVPNLNERGHNG